jgi:hypothetical protein
VTPVGPSARGSWSLRAGLKGGGPNELVEVGLRVRRVGDGLLGIWRHEGAERTRGAHAGILTGSLEGGAAPEPSPCVVDCLAACADLAPADARGEFLAAFHLMIDGSTSLTAPILALAAVTVGLGYGFIFVGFLSLVGSWLMWKHIPLHIQAPKKSL